MGLRENCKITMCREERDDVIGCAEFAAKDTNVLTNADRIRAMSDEELYDLLKEAYNAGCDDATAYEWGSIRNSFEWTEEWLKQPAE